MAKAKKMERGAKRQTAIEICRRLKLSKKSSPEQNAKADMQIAKALGRPLASAGSYRRYVVNNKLHVGKPATKRATKKAPPSEAEAA